MITKSLLLPLVVVFLTLNTLFVVAGVPAPAPCSGDGGRADTTVPKLNMANLRKAAAIPPGGVYVIDNGMQGFFSEDAGDSRSADDSAMTLVTATGKRMKRVLDNGIVDARWFGAVPDDGKDDWAAIQKAVDFCTANGNRYTTVHLSPGTYQISRPIMLYQWSGVSYAFNSTSIEGESSFWPSSGNGTILQCSFKDKFAIGVQLGKGNHISRLKIVGGFTPPFRDQYSFYRSTFEQFKDPTCRDSNFSPYSGIVIDPFANGQMPSDGGYPGYSAWYRGDGRRSGSTGISIEDVSIYGFVVGICSAPNSFTRNAELTNINKVQFENTKLCISGSQDQEKGNIVTNLGCWGTTHTVFATGLYGAQLPGNWYIENCNIAGYVNRLVFNSQAGYFGSHFKNIFSEMLGRFGTVYSNQGTVVEASEFGFAYYTEQTSQYLSPQIDANGVTFIGCNIRMYGTFKPVTLAGASVYSGCTFEALPYSDYTSPLSPTFVECRMPDYANQLGVTGPRNIYAPLASKSFVYGHYSLVTGTSTLTINSARPGAAYPVNLSSDATTLNIVAAKGVRSAVIALKQEEAGRVRVGDVICDNPSDNLQQGVIGTATAVTGSSYTIAYIPDWVTSGQSLHPSVFLPFSNMTFLGDITAGSNKITNVVTDFGNLDFFITTCGGLMQCNKFVNTQGNQPWRNAMFRVVAYDAASRTITVDQQATATVKGAYFANGNSIKDLHTENYGEGFIYLDKYGSSELVQEGGHIYTADATGRTVSYLVTKSGFYNAAANHDTRQGEWRKE